MVVNFGLEQVRFPYPIKVDSNIRARTKLSQSDPIKGGLRAAQGGSRNRDRGSRRPGCVIEVSHPVSGLTPSLTGDTHRPTSVGLCHSRA